MSFPRKWESRTRQENTGHHWIPAFAGMTALLVGDAHLEDTTSQECSIGVPPVFFTSRDSGATFSLPLFYPGVDDPAVEKGDGGKGDKHAYTQDRIQVRKPDHLIARGVRRIVTHAQNSSRRYGRGAG